MRLRTLSVLMLLFLGMLTAQAQNKGYHIKVKLDGYKNDTCILGYRLGSKTYVKDTIMGRNDQGYFVFKADTVLKGGVYLILTKPENYYFEFLVPSDDEQNITIQTKPEGADFTKNLKITGSPDNKAFVDYLHFLGDMSKESKPLSEKMQNPKTSPEEKAKVQEKLNVINTKVEQYQKEMIAKNPTYLSSRLIQAAQQPKVPQELQIDQKEAYLYYKAHYWDDFAWGDARLIRTPVFEQKIEFYTDKLTVQDPDSVIAAVDYILGNVVKAGDKDMFQFAAAHLLNKYAKTKVICMDKVYVHIGSKYYCNGDKPEWIDQEQLDKICENVQDLRYSLCGQQAQPIELTNIATGKPINLYSLKSKFVVVYFWDPTCGNCTKTSKKLVPLYEKWKDNGLEIYGICSKNIDEIDQCKKKIEDVGIKWINTTDKSYPLAMIKKLYNVKVNPFVYLLDKDKKIMYKRLDPAQIDEILTRELGAPEGALQEEINKKDKEVIDKELKDQGRG
jgi:peroxiredoxin